MRSKIVLSGLVLALVASNAYFAARRQTVVIYRDDFASAIDDMVRHQGRRFVLVIGDSITERSTLPLEICGGPLVKLGIGGSRASTFIPFAEVMNSRKIAPSLIVVALGLNDAKNIGPASASATICCLIPFRRRRSFSPRSRLSPTNE